ncbi:Uncharacterised protein [uncultured archaeon]|nr:Uncharacterised protein [uncultured archaeon]
MRKIIYVLLLICLVACQTAPKPIQKTTPENITDVNKAAVLEQFAKLDLELNSSWHEESLPSNPIKLKNIEPWTANMLFLKNRIAEKNDTVLLDLVDARMEMLKSQLAFYLMLKVGENGTINMTKTNKTFTPTQEIDCRNSKVIAKSLGLYYSSYAAWKNFTILMDKALQDQELRSQIGANQNKPKFYNPPFADALEYIKAAKKAVYDQCEVEIVMQDMLPNPQPASTAS